jgi:hypothetical protein
MTLCLIRLGREEPGWDWAAAVRVPTASGATTALDRKSLLFMAALYRHLFRLKRINRTIDMFEICDTSRSPPADV